MKLEEHAKTAKKHVSIKSDIFKNLLTNLSEMIKMLRFKSQLVDKSVEEIRNA